jgi:hypothetical protein
MNKTAKIAMLAVLGCVVLFTGCDKKVDLSFTNTTDQTLSLQLTTPEEGTQMLGVLPPTGGKLKHEVKISEDDLPANCMWRAGDITGEFTINKKSPNWLGIDILPTGGRVRDKKTAVNDTHKSETKTKVSQDTVVE